MKENGAKTHSDSQADRRPFRRFHQGSVRAALVSLAAVAALLTFAVPGTAQAAQAGKPSVEFRFSHREVAAGTKPRLTYFASDIPSGSKLYLQRQFGPSHVWENVERLRSEMGTVTAPADPAGHYHYRVRVSDGRHAVAISAHRRLTAVATSGQTGAPAPSTHSGCSYCSALFGIGSYLLPYIIGFLS